MLRLAPSKERAAVHRPNPVRRVATPKRASLPEASCLACCWLAHLLAHEGKSPVNRRVCYVSKAVICR